MEGGGVRNGHLKHNIRGISRGRGWCPTPPPPIF